MKKNVMMRVASALGVAVLLTTCVISGTFAKYVTSSNSSDTARVAKWGFDSSSTVTITDLFTYTDTNVQSKNDDKVIAPGTTNSVNFGFVYNATNGGSIAAPEVAYTFVVDTTDSVCGDTIKNNPNIKWYLDDALAPASGSATEGSWDALLAAIKALGSTETVAAGTLPESFYGDPAVANKTHKVGWAWLFDKDSPTGTTDNDSNDTEMGNAETLATVTLKITITATQVD